MKILIHYWKHETVYYDASTDVKRNEALRDIFEFLQDAGYYEDIEETPEGRQLDLFSDAYSDYQIYQLALDGDIQFIKWVLYSRQEYEYERWEEVKTEN